MACTSLGQTLPNGPRCYLARTCLWQPRPSWAVGVPVEVSVAHKATAQELFDDIARSAAKFIGAYKPSTVLRQTIAITVAQSTDVDESAKEKSVSMQTAMLEMDRLCGVQTAVQLLWQRVPERSHRVSQCHSRDQLVALQCPAHGHTML